MTNLPVIPDAGMPVSADQILEAENQIKKAVKKVDDIKVLKEWMDQAAALESYLRGKDMQKPIQGAARRVEARIGQLLGKAPGRGKSEMTPHAALFHHARRDEFRTEALAEENGEFTDDEWRQSRRAFINFVRIKLGLNVQPIAYEHKPVIKHCSIQKLKIDDNSVDAIITDPPYPKQFLPVYETLAKKAAQWLKPDGSLVVMCGHIYLPEILAMMTQHITYNWTLAYMVPGKSGSAIKRHVRNIGWKPVLHFCNGEANIGYDVIKSDTSESEIFHEWGQSLSGTERLVEMFSKPDQLIVDPFLGGGTCAIASYKLGRRFIGCDSDKVAIATSKERLSVIRQA